MTKLLNRFMVHAQLNINIERVHFLIISIFGTTPKFFLPILISSKLNIGIIESNIFIKVFII